MTIWLEKQFLMLMIMGYSILYPFILYTNKCLAYKHCVHIINSIFVQYAQKTSINFGNILVVKMLAFSFYLC